MRAIARCSGSASGVLRALAWHTRGGCCGGKIVIVGGEAVRGGAVRQVCCRWRRSDAWWCCAASMLQVAEKRCVGVLCGKYVTGGEEAVRRGVVRQVCCRWRRSDAWGCCGGKNVTVGEEAVRRGVVRQVCCRWRRSDAWGCCAARLLQRVGESAFRASPGTSRIVWYPHESRRREFPASSQTGLDLMDVQAGMSGRRNRRNIFFYCEEKRLFTENKRNNFVYLKKYSQF
jgi:hypothetical protein